MFIARGMCKYLKAPEGRQWERLFLAPEGRYVYSTVACPSNQSPNGATGRSVCL